MDPVVSVQNKNFSGNTKELAKVPGTQEGTKSHCAFLEISSDKFDVSIQTSVSHISTELEILSFDARLRLDGLPALNSRDLYSP